MVSDHIPVETVDNRFGGSGAHFFLLEPLGLSPAPLGVSKYKPPGIGHLGGVLGIEQSWLYL